MTFAALHVERSRGGRPSSRRSRAYASRSLQFALVLDACPMEGEKGVHGPRGRPFAPSTELDTSLWTMESSLGPVGPTSVLIIREEVNRTRRCGRRLRTSDANFARRDGSSHVHLKCTRSSLWSLYIPEGRDSGREDGMEIRDKPPGKRR